MRTKYDYPLFGLIVSTTLLLGGLGIFMLIGDILAGMTWSACCCVVLGFFDGMIFAYAVEERRVASQSD